jgi:hypothetical protein
MPAEQRRSPVSDQDTSPDIGDADEGDLAPDLHAGDDSEEVIG